MKVGDLVRVKPRYADWDYGFGVLIDNESPLCRVLLEGKVVIFHRHELEVVSESR